MLISSQAIGQIYYSLETGVIDRQIAIRNNDCYAVYNMNKYIMYSDIMFGYKYKKVHIEFDLMNTFDKSKSVYFKPELIKYDCKIYYKYKNIKIGYEHSCSHPIYNEIISLDKTVYRASFDKFFIKYEFYQ
jgi:hypothetical protein